VKPVLSPEEIARFSKKTTVSHEEHKASWEAYEAERNKFYRQSHVRRKDSVDRPTFFQIRALVPSFEIEVLRLNNGLRITRAFWVSSQGNEKSVTRHSHVSQVDETEARREVICVAYVVVLRDREKDVL